ncbi:MAG TPA: translation initiation factor IF-2 [Bryobacteraceae bacterium]|nr:translation initiation factor IF-2 [Bryobacteraceae bacterium]
MKKIRINELARELEVKPGVILDLLPELGVQEKKTHSSSIDEDVAIELRNRLVGTGGMGSEYSNGHPHDHEDDDIHTTEHERDEHHVSSAESITAVAEDEQPQQTRAVQAEPVRPPLGPSFQPPLRAPVRPPQVAHQAPSMPVLPPAHAAAIPIPPAHAAQASSAPVTEVATASGSTPAHLAEERPIPRFQPLRPPVGSGLHPPVAPAPATPIPAPGPPTQAPSPAPQAAASPAPPNRNVTFPSRPSPMTPRPSGSALPTGPRQPLPPEATRPPLGDPQRATRPPGAQGGYPRQSPRQTALPAAQVPTHIIAPGPASAGPTTPSTSAVPGAPIPPRPATPKPNQPNLRPGAPIAPRPQSTRPVLAGQPAARPVVPPRPDLVARLQQTQVRPSPAAPIAPRPGAPTRSSSPTPGQPIYRGPVRPGQPTMRGPGMPGPAGPAGPLPRRPGMRPMHPTTPLRAEPSTPLPTEQQRRHQAKPGARQGPRKREDEEGNLRLRSSKRSAVLEPPPIDREITVAEGVTVKELSEKLGVKANLVIKKLVERKIFATINQTLDVKLAEELARDFGASTNQVSYEEESTQDIELAEENKDLVRRAPVVTIMGHVDHGKTSLLDAIRQTNVAGREAGGITQHIGAYYIEKNGRKIVFIDTPGHQAFTRMRARGAKVTDIVVLVVSADDGVMPQTLEAISHAKAAGVPLLVAINKIDKPDAQPDRVKQQLSDRGLLAEDWGGDVVMVPVSAKTGQNLDLLLEMILLVADLQDLKANPNRPALGTVLEAQLDRGRGPVATMLVRNGTLRIGDFFICGALFSKVRAMFDDRGNAVKEAEPSMPVEVIGLDSLPEVGDSFQVVSDTSKAKQIVIYREAKARDVAMAKGARVATLDSLHKQFKEGDLKDLNLIIKADVGGTAEVLSDTLQQLSTDKVRVRVLHAGVGTITEGDVLLASASDAVIIGFNTKPDRNAQAVAEQQKVTIRLHSIIYELIDETKLAMSGLLDPVYKETIQGHAEVKEIFKISKIGTVAGCFVSDGVIRRDSQIRVMRGRDLIHTGKIQALKRFKNDASEVKNGLECGISLTNFNSINVGDVFEAFTMERIAPELPTAS